MTRKRRWAVAAVVLAVVMVVSLALTNAWWVRTHRPNATTPPVTATPSASPTLDPEPLISPPPTHGTTDIDNLSDIHDSVSEDGARIDISEPKATGDTQLTDPIAQYIAKVRSDFTSGVKSATGAMLKVSWDVITAAGPYLGITVHVSTTTDTDKSHTETKSFFVDTAKGETIEGRRLLTNAARERALIRLGGTAEDVRFSDAGEPLVVGQEGAYPLPISGDTVTPEGLKISRAVSSREAFSPLPAPPPPKRQPKPDSSGVDCSKVKCIALTFDDGPAPSTTKLLPILRKYQVPATFFMLGNAVAAHPDIAAAVANDGHAIASHTMTHPQLTKLSNDKIVSQLDQAADQIEKATGKRPTLVRPPYGAQNARVLSVLHSRGESSILWSVDTLDWKHRNPATTIKRALAGAKPGGIILMHDIHPTSVQAVEGVITGLKQKGFTFVTVDQLHR